MATSAQTLHDPVLAQDGDTYERKPVEQWIQEHGTNPLTLDHLHPNDEVKQLVQESKSSLQEKNDELTSDINVEDKKSLSTSQELKPLSIEQLYPTTTDESHVIAAFTPILNTKNDVSNNNASSPTQSAVPLRLLSQETMTDTNYRREYLFITLIIGDASVGKTSLVKRYTSNFFSEHYRATIGAEFASKNVKYGNDTALLQIWEMSGRELHGNMSRIYYRNIVGCFIVFDVTRNSTFENVIQWKNDLDSKSELSNGNPVPCVLIANKCDLTKEGLVNNPQQMDEFCREKGFVGWFETSAKENINVEQPFECLVDAMVKHDEMYRPRWDRNTIKLTNNSISKKDNGSCCYNCTPTN